MDRQAHHLLSFGESLTQFTFEGGRIVAVNLHSSDNLPRVKFTPEFHTKELGVAALGVRQVRDLRGVEAAADTDSEGGIFE